MGFYAHLNYTILFRPRHTHQDIARLTLPPVERGSFRLVDFARNQLPRAGDAATVFAGNWDLDARRLAGIINWLVFAHNESNPASVLQGHSMFLYAVSHTGSPNRKSSNRSQNPRLATFRWLRSIAVSARARSIGQQFLWSLTARCQKSRHRPDNASHGSATGRSALSQNRQGNRC